MSTGKIIGAFGIIGAILMVVCVFLEWGSIELIIGSSTSTYAFSGWDLFSDATVYKGSLLSIEIKISDLGISNYDYAPIVVLISGVIGIIATVLPMFVKSEAASKGLGILALILAVVSIVLMILYVTDLSDTSSFSETIKTTISASYGAYIGIVGALLMVIGGIADIAKKNC